MTKEKKITGNYGEELAAQFLKKRGYKVIERNKKNKLGEIDILAADFRRHPERSRKVSLLDQIFRRRPIIVIVEVKTKSGRDFGEGWEMVNYYKRKKLLLLAKSLQKDYPKSVVRIDIVSIDTSVGPPEIRHFENAVEESS